MLFTCVHTHGEVGGWGRDPFSRNFMKPTPRRKWYLTTGRRFHEKVLDPIPQSLPVHFFGSRPQPPTSPHMYTDKTPHTLQTQNTHTHILSYPPPTHTLSVFQLQPAESCSTHKLAHFIPLRNFICNKTYSWEGFTDTVTYAHLRTHAHSLHLHTHAHSLLLSYTHNLPKQLVCANLRCTLYSTLHTATLCNTLQHSATLCNTLQHRSAKATSMYKLALRSVLPAKRCSTLQHIATHIRTLQHSATLCNSDLPGRLVCTNLRCACSPCNTLQHAAANCNTLQHTATRCNTLQHKLVCANSRSALYSVQRTIARCTTRCDTLLHTPTYCNANHPN